MTKQNKLAINFLIVFALSLCLLLPAFQVRAEDREPAQAPTKPSPTTAVASDETAKSISSGNNPRFQYSLSGGVVYKSNDDLTGSYSHQTSESPVGRFGFHYAFFRNKMFNLLLGADLIISRSLTRASSSTATATVTTERVDGGPVVGVGFYPAGPEAAFQFQAFLGTGANLSYTRTLQSPGFTTTIPRSSTVTGVVISGSLYGVYAFTPKWRILGGFLSFDAVQTMTLGVAYAL